jgi:immune inhibitor A
MGTHPGRIIALVILGLVACTCLTVVCLASGLLIWNVSKTPQAAPQVTLMPSTASTGAEETLNLLEKSLVPISDPRDLARRLKRIDNVPLTLPAPSVPFKIGDTQKVWLSNLDTNKNFQAEVELGAVTEHAYVWLEKGLTYNKDDLNRLADTFENKIYPTDRNFFGSEWTPGIDNDPHIYIFFAKGIGQSVAGYFSAVDELNPLVYPFSNAHESFYLNSDILTVGDDAYSTLAHEMQHMIHWYQDRNEETWLNEGFSVLAELLNGYNTGGADYQFALNPDQQLNDWPEGGAGVSIPYYGSSFLFVTYFLDRFGNQATQAVIGNKDNGLDSMDQVLRDLGIKDHLTGKQIQADDVFGDWAVTNYLEDARVGDGRFTYKIYPGAPKMGDTETFDTCPMDWQDRTVHQYGTDYIRLSCSGKLNLSFEGTSNVGVLPVNPHSGQYAFWSNRGDDSDMTLTHEFDFTKVAAPIQMSYWTWYDLEKDYDYAYLTASIDDSNWEIIKTRSCTTENPMGGNYGCGTTGMSKVWTQETVDLSKFAGKKVQLRFEYVTDAAVNKGGFLLDDVQIPALSYAADFEKDDGGWMASGFARIQNLLPQTFRISIIREGKSTTVETLAPGPGQKIKVALDFGNDLQNAVLVVSGTTRFTREEAKYRFELSPE